MQIDELAGNTVKITLNPSDMDGYRIKCEDISGDSRTSELALSRLISCLSEDHNLGLCGERLLVEAFPKSDGGCTLYISCLKGTPSGKNASCRPPLTAVICEGELCVLARLCKALKTVADRVSLYADRDGKITVLPFICRRANRPKAASELYGTSCRSTAFRYIRISAV